MSRHLPTSLNPHRKLALLIALILVASCAKKAIYSEATPVSATPPMAAPAKRYVQQTAANATSEQATLAEPMADSAGSLAEDKQLSERSREAGRQASALMTAPAISARAQFAQPAA
jgi:hypothetical protein